ncbi:LysR substrate-binding domain-containing protein [Streptomyces nigra]|uniref:LysR substrate-binding domain-containing protein n=1 Tax=Streptomyces nigra TaxID=1827580 RepID=UPI003453581D
MPAAGTAETSEYLAKFIAQFHTSHPAVDIRPTPAQEGSKALLRDVSTGELDLAFVSSVGTPPAGVHLMRITSVPLFLAVPETHSLAARTSVALRELADQAFIDAPVGWGNRALTDHAFAQAGVERTVSVELGDVLTVVQLVRAGLALAFAPRIPHTDTPGVCLIPCSPALLLDIHLAVSTRRRPSPAARAFISTVEAGLRTSAAPDRRPHIQP